MPDSGVTHKPVRLIHLSDIHFGAEDTEALSAVEDFVAHVKPDGIIIAGDITQTGKRKQFEAGRAWFDKLGFPVISAPGNHDTPVFHIPARVVAPFDRYERYMEGMNIVGQIRNFGDGHVRVSAINCFEVSSKQTTGRAGSSGSAYRSSTSSIRQTNSGPTVGITHSLWSHGLRTFF